MKPQPATLQRFPETPEGIATYRACLQAGCGFIANCTGGYPKGYMFHRASCSFLDLHKDRNPIRGATGKIWANHLKELEKHQAGSYTAKWCRCLLKEPPEEYDTDMPRESPLVVPGGQVESNRSRH